MNSGTGTSLKGTGVESRGTRIASPLDKDRRQHCATTRSLPASDSLSLGADPPRMPTQEHTNPGTREKGSLDAPVQLDAASQTDFHLEMTRRPDRKRHPPAKVPLMEGRGSMRGAMYRFVQHTARQPGVWEITQRGMGRRSI